MLQSGQSYTETSSLTGKRCVSDKQRSSVSTNGIESMAKLQIKGVDWHFITHRQHSHSGEVASRISDISTCCHTGQTKGWTWQKGNTICKWSIGMQKIHRLMCRLYFISSPEKGPRPCCKLPRIFWPNKWISRVTTWIQNWSVCFTKYSTQHLIQDFFWQSHQPVDIVFWCCSVFPRAV